MLLKEYINIVNGYPFNANNLNFNYKNIPVIKIKELKNNKVIFTDETQYAAMDSRLSNFVIKKGDIIVALTGNPPSKTNKDALVGRASIYSYNKNAYLNQRICKVSSNSSKLLNKYLYYFLINDNTLIKLSNMCTGSANQANISSNDIQNLDIILPDVSVQQHIVDTIYQETNTVY